jgi:cell division septum initiation protein DivIVA
LYVQELQQTNRDLDEAVKELKEQLSEQGDGGLLLSSSNSTQLDELSANLPEDYPSRIAVLEQKLTDMVWRC